MLSAHHTSLTPLAHDHQLDELMRDFGMLATRLHGPGMATATTAPTG